MAYNKEQHLRDNIEAIKLASFVLGQQGHTLSEQERTVLSRYAGFGGLKAVLNPMPLEGQSAPADWTSEDKKLYPLLLELHEALRGMGTEQVYKRYLSSIKNSVLTAFYTPKAVVDVVADVLREQGVQPQRFLDPSAGMGEFIRSFKKEEAVEAVGCEKDEVTGLMLSLLYPQRENNQVYVDGFEKIDSRYNDYFDVVSSNIPFGDFAVFDESYLREKNPEKSMSTKAIHNYFFVKGVDTLRQGGILAFITSQGVMNSPANEEVRRYLMEHTNLVSAVRLPNNLFRDYAGTEVGSDLIILQKSEPKNGRLTGQEQAFILSSKQLDGTMENHYISQSASIVSTTTRVDTDPYGKPARVYFHEGGVEGIAADMRERLTADFAQRLDREAYHPAMEEPQEVTPMEEPMLSLYDLFGMSDAERMQLNKTKRERKKEQKARSTTTWTPPVPVTFTQPKEKATLSLEPSRWTFDREKWYANGTLVKHPEHELFGYLKMSAKEIWFIPLDVSPEQQQKALLYLDIQNTYERLYEHEYTYQTEEVSLRKELNRLYDSFLAKYGYLNAKENLSLIVMDIKGRAFLSLERFEQRVAIKADIFASPVAFSLAQASKRDTPEETLISSLNQYGSVNLDYMASLSGMPTNELVGELKGRIFFNPLVDNYEISDRFIAGNVVEKAEQVEQWLLHNPHSGRVDESLTALKEAAPQAIAFEELDFNLGERWIDTKTYSDFASSLFGEEITITYSPSLDDYQVIRSRYRHNPVISNQFKVKGNRRSYDGISLMGYALLNTVPDIQKSVMIDGKEYKTRDNEAIQLANTKIEEIRTAFVDWLQEQSTEEKEALSQLYNRTFNCFVRPSYDGSHQTFPNLSFDSFGYTDLYQSQKDAIWMLKQNGGGICDHTVGGGKTMIMCVGAYEMKRLELANKPMIIALKANVGEIAETYKKAYPTAKVLYPSEMDFTPARRTALFNSIKNNNWDVIILTHDQFGKIPQSLDIQKEILQEELDSVEENLSVLKSQGKEISRGMLKGLEKRKENLSVKLQTIASGINQQKDNVLDFKQMGIDHLLVDESHSFKNLLFNTRHSRVAGLGSQEGSQKSLNLLFALRTIQQRTGRDLGATFLSGTTVSNSLTELYLLFKYLRPKALERQKITCFDAWIAIFAKKTTEFEFSVTNQIINKERFRYFIKVPELAAFYNLWKVFHKLYYVKYNVM